MTVQETRDAISKVEKMKRRGLLSVYEAKDRIEQLIDEQYPSDRLYLYTPETIAHFLEQKRLLYRRLWRFLLNETKEKVNVSCI